MKIEPKDAHIKHIVNVASAMMAAARTAPKANGMDNLECFALRKILWSRVGKTADRSRVKRFLYSALDIIPEERALACLDRMIEKAGKTTSGWVRILMFPTPNRKYAYLKKWYETGKDITFEGYVLSGVSDPDEYLTFKFGDYRLLPPAEQRKIHPVSQIRLVTPKVRGGPQL